MYACKVSIAILSCLLAVLSFDNAIAQEIDPQPAASDVVSYTYFSIELGSLITTQRVCQAGGLLHVVRACLCDSENRRCFVRDEAWPSGFFDDGYREDGKCQWNDDDPDWPPPDPILPAVVENWCQNACCYDEY